jgi:hypothetical protein
MKCGLQIRTNEWKLETKVGSANFVLFIHSTESSKRKKKDRYESCEKVCKVFMRWKDESFYGNNVKVSMGWKVKTKSYDNNVETQNDKIRFSITLGWFWVTKSCSEATRSHHWPKLPCLPLKFHKTMAVQSSQTIRPMVKFEDVWSYELSLTYVMNTNMN